MSTDRLPPIPDGVTLEMIVTALVERHGWEALGREIPIRCCFQLDPSIKSSMTFLRRTPWARARVEAFYCRELPSLPRCGASSIRASAAKGAKSGHEVG